MITTHETQKNWSAIKGKISAKWSKFNDIELEGLKGNLDKLSDQLQKTYGIAKSQAEADYADFRESIQTLLTTPQPDTTASEGVMPPKSKVV